MAPLKGTLLVPKQLGFQQVFGNGGTVQGDKWPVYSTGAAVDVAGDDFFAGAGLAGDQDACFGGCNLLGATNGFEHNRVARDQLVHLARCGLENGSDQLGVGW